MSAVRQRMDYRSTGSPFPPSRHFARSALPFLASFSPSHPLSPPDPFLPHLFVRLHALHTYIYPQPTNHLDLAAIRWLTDLVKERKKMTLLTVTHDRAFLEDVCDSILELDRGRFYSYDGSYSSYLRGKEERLANEDQALRVAKGRYKGERE